MATEELQAEPEQLQDVQKLHKKVFLQRVILFLLSNMVLALNQVNLLPMPSLSRWLAEIPLFYLSWLFFLFAIPYFYYLGLMAWQGQRNWGYFSVLQIKSALLLFQREPERFVMPAPEALPVAPEGDSPPKRKGIFTASSSLSGMEKKARKQHIKRLQACLFLFSENVKYGNCGILAGVLTLILLLLSPSAGILSTLLGLVGLFAYGLGSLCLFLEVYEHI